MNMMAAVTAGEDSQACAFCGESVSLLADRCTRCGEGVGVASRPPEEAPRSGEMTSYRPPLASLEVSTSASAASVVAAAGEPRGSWLVLLSWVVICLPIAFIYWYARRWS